MGEELAGEAECIAVQPFSPEESEYLFKSKLKKRKMRLLDHDHSERLLEVLAFIPLAITQAAAFINQTTMSIQDYLALLEKNNENFKDALSTELQDSRRQIGFPNSVFRTWKLSFDQILNQNPRAGELLSLMAMLDRHHIPKRLLQSSTERQVDFELALGILDGFALITNAMTVDAFALHPLVQASIQYWLENEQMIKETTQKALELLDRVPVKESNFDPPVLRGFEPISPHAQAVLSHCHLSKIITIPFANLSLKLANFEYLNAKLDAALQSASEAHSAFQAILGDFAPDTLLSLRSQANTLAFKRNAGLAEEVLRRALSGYEKMSNPDNRGRIACIRELSAVLQLFSKHNEAEDLCRSVLDERPDDPGYDAKDTLNLRLCLASALRKQHKFEEAEHLSRRALRDHNALFHDIMYAPAALIEVAKTFQAQGRYAEAELLIRQTIERREKAFGPEHPASLTANCNLALLLAKKGQSEAAEKLFRQILERQEVVLGLNSPKTLLVVQFLARVLHDQGLFAEAESLYRRAMEGSERVHGSQHPRSLSIVHDLANLLGDQGRQDAAEELYVRVLKGEEASLGLEHRWTLTTIHGFAHFL